MQTGFLQYNISDVMRELPSLCSIKGFKVVKIDLLNKSIHAVRNRFFQKKCNLNLKAIQLDSITTKVEINVKSGIKEFSDQEKEILLSLYKFF